MTIATTLMLLFLIALGLSIAFTPIVRALGIRLGAMDIPMERKIHSKPIPRIGGLVVLLSFFITFVLSVQYMPRMADLYTFNASNAIGYLGVLVVFSCGLWDDFRRLNPWTKLFFQIFAATLAFIGGAKISGIFLLSHGINFNIFFSYLITVFWFLLFINAINLIDGLDGLACGLVFFTCLVMVISTYIHGDYLNAFYFAILGGAVLGFLKYNFNPATIFLGDGGSYFLGYMIAIVSIRGSIKSHVSILMLIPLLALGVPIFDSMLSPIRRFIRGQSMFQPDKEHIHHLFLKKGFSSLNAVLLIYGITMGLCILAIFITVFRGYGLEGISFAVLLFGMIFLVRKLGYLEYFALDKVYGWFNDVTDITGISQRRRSFLSLQIDANNTQNMDELWGSVIEALEMLKFNQAQLYLENEPVREWKMERDNYLSQANTSGSESKDLNGLDSLLKIEIPLKDEGDEKISGKLVLVKDLNQGELQPYTIRRMESLRRTLVNNIKRLQKQF